jgi:hypothetical protein
VTARRRPRRRRSALTLTGPLLALLAVLAVLVLGLDVLAHWWGLAVVAAACGGYWLGRRQAPAAVDGRELARTVTERDTARRELDAVRGELCRTRALLANARESAALAWDASADRPPRPPAALPDPGTRRSLLADPR